MTNYGQCASRLAEQRPINLADRLFAAGIAKRQMQIVRDLMALNDTYPGIIDKDLVGGLYALGCYLEDSVESIRKGYRAQ